MDISRKCCNRRKLYFAERLSNGAGVICCIRHKHSFGSYSTKHHHTLQKLSNILLDKSAYKNYRKLY